jgi:hypothetical protein
MKTQYLVVCECSEEQTVFSLKSAKGTKKLFENQCHSEKKPKVRIYKLVLVKP